MNKFENLTTSRARLSILNVALALNLFVGAHAYANKFHFVAIGDLAYDTPDDYPAYGKLIDIINATEPSFSVHLGDLGGGSVCWDEERDRVVSLFERFSHPLVYTPGDNEWLDCGQNFDQLERLNDLRRRFFDKSASLGQTTIPLQRQSEIYKDRYADYVENARFMLREVMIATVHVAGSHNGSNSENEAVVHESFLRTNAAIDWINAVFDEAETQNAKAVVILLHASMFQQDTRYVSPPYKRIVRRLQAAGTRYGKPVLVVHGDAHQFIVDRVFNPPQNWRIKLGIGDITRLQVFGHPLMRAVRVDIDTSTPWIFSFSPLYEINE